MRIISGSITCLFFSVLSIQSYCQEIWEHRSTPSGSFKKIIQSVNSSFTGLDGNQFDKFGAKYFTLDNYNMLYTSVNDKLKSSTDYGDNWKDIEIVEGANLAAYQAEYTF